MHARTKKKKKISKLRLTAAPRMVRAFISFPIISLLGYGNGGRCRTRPFPPASPAVGLGLTDAL